MQKMMKVIENEALLKMITELEITDEQMPKFISKFREMTDLLRQQKENREKIIDHLRRMISSQELNEKIEEKISDLEKYSDSMYDQFKKFRDDIKNMLSGSPIMPAMPYQTMQSPIKEFKRQMPDAPVHIQAAPDR